MAASLPAADRRGSTGEFPDGIASPRRWAVVLSILVWPAGAWFVARHGVPFECLFHRVTHLHCPGCGSGRALASLTHGHPLQAIRQNLLLVPALVFLVYQHLDRSMASAWGRPVLPRWRVGLDGYVRTMALVGVFWILRNLPFEPFRWLAPSP
ncbi:MAG TPA: DUF2752 domain-containing protein [Fibrobacteria bacterium]|nr:DUF2752 domain-containing protein [Fibrobacteria bacterium]